MEIDLNPAEHHLLLIEEQRDRVILLEAERYLIGRNDSNEIVLNFRNALRSNKSHQGLHQAQDKLFYALY